jgi:hypothetical protein
MNDSRKCSIENNMKLIFNTILLVLVSLGCSTTQKNVFILPKDFTGYILVIYNQTADLSNNTFEDGVKTFYVPGNGIIKLNEKNNGGWEEIPAFYYITKEESQRIPFVLDVKNIPGDKIVASGGSVIKSYSNSNSKEYIEYEVYFIGNDKQITEAYERVESFNFGSISKL